MRCSALKLVPVFCSLVALANCGGIANLGTPTGADGGSADAGSPRTDGAVPTADSGPYIGPPVDTGTNYFARFAMELAYFNKANVCAAHKQADGSYKWENVYESAGLTPTDVSSLNRAEKPITRYFALSAKPDGFNFQASTVCPIASKTAPEVVVNTTSRYITVITVPFSGEVPQTEVIDDPGPNLPAPIGAELRVVNASSYDTSGIQSQLVAKDGTTSAASTSQFLGPAVATYLSVPSGLGQLKISATTSNPATSTSLAGFANDAYTAYVTGFEGQKQIILCRDRNTAGMGAKAAYSDCTTISR
jgi:hypothetical protein